MATQCQACSNTQTGVIRGRGRVSLWAMVYNHNSVLLPQKAPIVIAETHNLLFSEEGQQLCLCAEVSMAKNHNRDTNCDMRSGPPGMHIRHATAVIALLRMTVSLKGNQKSQMVPCSAAQPCIESGLQLPF